MFRIGKLVFVFVFALTQVRSDVPEKIFLTIYYESQCPDSKDFMVKQLLPTVSLLEKYLSVKLIPFGKANSINDGKDGFHCQHGPTECAGNILQSCALDIMQERSDLAKVSYVTCEMQTEAAIRGDAECIIEAGISPELVGQCATSQKGVSLQLDEEYYTNLLKPHFIPTVTINGVFNQQVQDSALQDLTGTLCSILKNTPPCARHYNKLALSYVLL